MNFVKMKICWVSQLSLQKTLARIYRELAVSLLSARPSTRFRTVQAALADGDGPASSHLCLGGSKDSARERLLCFCSAVSALDFC